MTYMNNVEEGGETAFVIADNMTYDHQVILTCNYFAVQQFCVILELNG